MSRLVSLSAPDFVQTEPIQAHREWWYNRSLSRLESVVFPTCWPPCEKFEAVCELVPPVNIPDFACPDSPNPDCTCGIFAFKDSSQPETWLKERSTVFDVFHKVHGGDARDFMDSLSRVPVIGTVSMWGRVVRHKQGYRAQWAYPYEVVVPRWAPLVAEEIRSSYGVDARVMLS